MFFDAGADDDDEPETDVLETLGGAADDSDGALAPVLEAEGDGGTPPEGTDDGKAGLGPNAGVITPTAEARLDTGGPGKT